MSRKEPRNPFYLLLLVTGFLFAVTAIAYTVVPWLEHQANIAGNPPPPSPFRDAIRNNGATWLLIELFVLVVLGLMSMGLDRLRSLKEERQRAKMPSDVDQPPPT